MINQARSLVPTSILLLLFLQSTAEADIVLTIDKVAKTAELSGSDTGTPVVGGSAAVVFWTIFTGIESQTFVNVDTSAVQFAITDWTLTQPVNYSLIQAATTTGVRIQIISSVLPDGQVTVTPLGGPIDHSSLSAGLEVWFESLIGGEIPVLIGSGFSPISVRGAAIPEPTSFLACFGMGTVAIARRRRIS